MEYPEEIYQVFSDDMCGSGRRHAYEVGFQAGRAEKAEYIKSISSLESVLTDVEQLEGEDLPFVKSLIERTVQAVRAEQADPLAGYSNLTAAISAGEPIDWERLDGLNVKCVNPDVGTLRGVLMRNGRKPDTSDAWWGEEATASYINALYDGWKGNKGWTLYVEGEIPLRRKTADQLKPGTEFYGVEKNSEPDGVAPELMLRTQGHVLHLDDYTISQMPPRHFEVVKVVGVYGTFQKPEGK